MSANFKCELQPCPYESPKFSRILNYVWNIHSLESAFRYTCGISNCPWSYTNLQSFKIHVRDQHVWFFEVYLKVFDKDLPNNIVNHEEYIEIEEDFDHFDGSIYQILMLW